MFYDPGNVLNRIVRIFSPSVRRKTREKLEPTLFPINYRCEFITDVSREYFALRNIARVQLARINRRD